MFDTINKYADFYFNFMIGEYPEEIDDYRKTANLFQYLIDAGISDGEVYMITEIVKPKKCLTIEDIPDKLWENSLLERDKFYFHKQLQITPPPPGWDIEHDYIFYREMKIRYTLDDVLDYFIIMTGVRAEWVARDKEKGSIKYLLKEYKKFNFMEPIDFLLHLIDYCVSCGREINSIYDLRDEEVELAKALEVDILNAAALGKNKVIWRS